MNKELIKILQEQKNLPATQIDALIQLSKEQEEIAFPKELAEVETITNLSKSFKTTCNSILKELDKVKQEKYAEYKPYVEAHSTFKKEIEKQNKAHQYAVEFLNAELDMSEMLGETISAIDIKPSAMTKTNIKQVMDYDIKQLVPLLIQNLDNWEQIIKIDEKALKEAFVDNPQELETKYNIKIKERFK